MANLFISHSHQDVLAARDLRALLEAAGYTCWMAPDDVNGPNPWAAQILDAIDASKVMIVLLSKAANDSNHVSKEVGLALERDKALLPVRVEDVMPTGSLQYLLQLVQWVDAFPGPMRDHLAQVRRSVASVVPTPAEMSSAVASPPVPLGAAPFPGAPPANAAQSPAVPASPSPPAAPDPSAQAPPPHSTWSTLATPAPVSPPPPAAAAPSLQGGPPPAAPPVAGTATGSSPRSETGVTQRTILASVGILAVAVVVAAVVLSGGPRNPPAPSPPASAAVLATPTPGPTQTAAPTPTESSPPSIQPTAAPPTPPPSSAPPTPAFPNAAEEALLHHVPAVIRSTCRVADASDHLRASAKAVLDCYPHAADAPNFIRYASFPTIQAMDGIFNLDVSAAGDRAVRGVACNESPYSGGLGTYTRNSTTTGQILCYLDGGTAWLEWSYEPGLILVAADRGDGDAQSLYEWWTNLDAAGPI